MTQEMGGMVRTLDGLSVYAFGDSIIYGHDQPEKSMLRLMAERYGWNLSIFAKNGATVLPGENQILQQVYAAPVLSPDLIVFDGCTNDAYGPKERDRFNLSGEKPDVTMRYGAVRGKGTAVFDQTTFCGAFEALIHEMRQKWPAGKIVYLTVHKSGARDFSIQSRLHDLTVRMCREWNVAAADPFADTDLDTRRAGDMRTYIIGGDGSHPNQACCEKFYIPVIAKTINTVLYNKE